MSDLFAGFLSSESFIPHGHCYLWKPGLVWLHLSSDALIALAYYSIPLTLFYFVRRRKDLPFNWIFLLFATFIVACGTTHILGIWTLWHPIYWVSGAVKAATASVSVFTAIQLVPLVPQALALSSPAQLEQANAELQTQIQERLRIEEELRHSQNQLEQRVQERTAELVAANEQLQREIRDRQNTEAALREREAQFRQLAENIHEVFWVADPHQGKVLYVSPAYETIWGCDRQSLYDQPQSWLSTLYGDDRARIESAALQMLTGETGFNEEYRIVRPDGEIRWIWARTSPVPDEAGQVYRIVGIAEDVTERKRTEAEIAALNRDLQDRVDELQTLFEVIPIGILIANNPEFKQIRANPAFAEILGVPYHGNASSTPPDESDRPSYKIFSQGRELTPAETPLRYAAIHGVDVKAAEVDVLRGDGVMFNLYGYASPLFDEQGKPRGAVGAFLDISERVRVEDERKRAAAEREQLLERERIAREQAVREAARSADANRVKDEFLAVLSHELRTPLNPILGWTRLLRTGNLDAQKTTLALETIERNAQLQTQLIEDLLDISRILQGKLTLNESPVDLAVTIEAAKETVRLAAEAKSIQVETELQSIDKQALGDSNRLQQVIWNLLSNAIKFTPAGGRVKVKLEYIGDQAQIQVQDTGKGISPDFLPYVFDTFRQADGTTTRQFGGLGLGLAIVRQIVELHGGTVEASSPGEGLGATFTVRLPLLILTLPTQSASSDPLLYPSSLKNLHILVVDDEADTRELITFVLQQAGATVTAVASAKSALVELIRSRPDVLLSDIGMPDTDGYSLMRQIRSLKPTQGANIPAIALTAYVGEFNQQQALKAGFQKHLPKPVEPERLTQAIVELLKPS